MCQAKIITWVAINCLDQLFTGCIDQSQTSLFGKVGSWLWKT